MRQVTLVLAAALLSGCGVFRGGAIQPTPLESVRVNMMNVQQQSVGEATLQQTPQGILLTLDLRNMPPGTHAVHFHETGRCEPTFDAAGGHWNPRGGEHGFMNPAGPHLGDLPNIHVPQGGNLRVEVLARDITLMTGQNALFDGDGAALIIHAFADDYRTDPSGNSGDRIACGPISR